MSQIPSRELLPPPAACSFSQADWYVLAQHWYPVARLIDIDSKPLGVTLLDVPLVLFRTSSGVTVARDICPHRGVPLSMGWVENEQLVCAYHGLHYAADGHCTQIPAQPNLSNISPRFSLKTFPAVERFGLLWTSLHSLEPILPELPTWDDPEHQAILPPIVDIAGSSGRQLEGFIDVAHFAWVHHEAFADRNNPVVPSYDTKLTEYGLRTEYWSNVSNYPKHLQHLQPEGFRWLRVFDVYPPFSAILTVYFPNDGVLKILNAACPISARKTRLFVPITRNFDQTGDVEDVYAFNAQVFAEDQAIVEAQRPEELPLDPLFEAHFQADRSSTTYRKILSGMGLGRQQTG